MERVNRDKFSVSQQREIRRTNEPPQSHFFLPLANPYSFTFLICIIYRHFARVIWGKQYDCSKSTLVSISKRSSFLKFSVSFSFVLFSLNCLKHNVFLPLFVLLQPFDVINSLIWWCLSLQDAALSQNQPPDNNKRMNQSAYEANNVTGAKRGKTCARLRASQNSATRPCSKLNCTESLLSFPQNLSPD